MVKLLELAATERRFESCQSSLHAKNAERLDSLQILLGHSSGDITLVFFLFF
jgi:hypothetical protein